MHKFEDTEMPIPKKWDEMLTSMYGDYMTPPPEDKRQGPQGIPTGRIGIICGIRNIKPLVSDERH